MRSIDPSLAEPVRGADRTRQGLLLLSMALTLALGGCAFGARNATLRYPPQAEPGAAVVAKAAAPVAQQGEIALTSFGDVRPA